jgi:hypothetical protein
MVVEDFGDDDEEEDDVDDDGGVIDTGDGRPPVPNRAVEDSQFVSEPGDVAVVSAVTSEYSAGGKEYFPRADAVT